MNESSASGGSLATSRVVLARTGSSAARVRDPIFLKLGLRNIPRRRGRSALIVVGLMLGTAIIAAALATGDTMSSTIRSYVMPRARPDGRRRLRARERTPSRSGTRRQPRRRAAGSTRRRTSAIRDAAASSQLVDGVAPAIIETVAVQDRTTRQNEPRVALFASDPRALDDFAEIRSGGRRGVARATSRLHEVYLNEDAADELGGGAGDRLLVLAGRRAEAVHGQGRRRVRRRRHRGRGAAAPAPRAHSICSAGPARSSTCSSRTAATRSPARSSATRSSDCSSRRSPRSGSRHPAEKRDGLEEADAQGNAFIALFTTFGSFSIAAGILLIFLIFVMLAAERRGELGIARAIGTRRGHLVKMYVFEGVAYDLIAAVVGTVLGIAVAYGMVLVMAAALGALGLEHRLLGQRAEHRARLRARRPAHARGRHGLGVAGERAQHRDGRAEPARAAKAARPPALGAADPRRRRGGGAPRVAASRRRRGCRSCSASRSASSACATIARRLGAPARGRVHDLRARDRRRSGCSRGASSTGSRRSRGGWTRSSSAG